MREIDHETCCLSTSGFSFSFRLFRFELSLLQSKKMSREGKHSGLGEEKQIPIFYVRGCKILNWQRRSCSIFTPLHVLPEFKWQNKFTFFPWDENWDLQTKLYDVRSVNAFLLLHSVPSTHYNTEYTEREKGIGMAIFRHRHKDNFFLLIEYSAVGSWNKQDFRRSEKEGDYMKETKIHGWHSISLGNSTCTVLSV